MTLLHFPTGKADSPKIRISQKPVLFEDGWKAAKADGTALLSVFDMIHRRSELNRYDAKKSDFWSGTLIGYNPAFAPFGEEFVHLHPATGKAWRMAIPEVHRGRPFLTFCIGPRDYDISESAGIVEVFARDIRFEELVASGPAGIPGKFPVSRIVGNCFGGIQDYLEIARASPPWTSKMDSYSQTRISELNKKDGFFGPVSLYRESGFMGTDYILLDHVMRYQQFRSKHMVAEEPAP